MASEIIAGCTTDINKGSGQWLIVDIGFSSKDPSCGVWNGAGKPSVVTFGGLVNFATQKVQEDDTQSLNLLIEAPLSVAFQQNDNPTRRSCDSQDGQYRDWYVNAGATTLIAAGYLLRVLNDCQRQRDVRLFEGFVSFKPSEARPISKAERIAAHKKDVLRLTNAVWTGANAKIFDPGELGQNPDHRIESAFPFLNKHLIPPVIRINRRKTVIPRLIEY